MNITTKRVVSVAIAMGLCLASTGFAATKNTTVHHARSSAAQVVSGPVNINSADAKQLTSLAGIGESKAKAIVSFRKANGPFSNVNDLTKVKGIGSKFIERLQKNNAGRIMV